MKKDDLIECSNRLSELYDTFWSLGMSLREDEIDIPSSDMKEAVIRLQDISDLVYVEVNKIIRRRE